MTVLVTLVGEQPIPNLLPVRALRPAQVLYVHTGRGPRGTEKVARRVARLVPESTPDFVLVDAHDLIKARTQLQAKLAQETDLVFNLTGGTKPMAIAAYALSLERAVPFVYFQSEGPHGREVQSVLCHYRFEQGAPVLVRRESLAPGLLSLDDYFRAHWEQGYDESGPSDERGGDLERLVRAVLEGWVDEIKAGVRPRGFKEQVEIDLAIRCGNQVGIIEVKTGGAGSGKHAVDQLTTVAARELSGTYTARFVVTGGEYRQEYRAVAQELSVRVVQVETYGNRLAPASVALLQQAIAEHLPCRHP